MNKVIKFLAREWILAIAFIVGGFISYWFFGYILLHKMRYISEDDFREMAFFGYFGGYLFLQFIRLMITSINKAFDQNFPGFFDLSFQRQALIYSALFTFVGFFIYLDNQDKPVIGSYLNYNQIHEIQKIPNPIVNKINSNDYPEIREWYVNPSHFEPIRSNEKINLLDDTLRKYGQSIQPIIGNEFIIALNYAGDIYLLPKNNATSNALIFANSWDYVLPPSFAGFISNFENIDESYWVKAIPDGINTVYEPISPRIAGRILQSIIPILILIIWFNRKRIFKGIYTQQPTEKTVL